MTTTAVADPVRAVARVLRGSTSVLSLVGNDRKRIFMDDFDDTTPIEVGEQARSAVIVRLAGADADASYLPVNGFDVDVLTYGQDAAEARRLALTVMHTLKHEETSKSNRGELLYSLSLRNGPISIRDTRSGWRYCVQSWLALMGDGG